MSEVRMCDNCGNLFSVNSRGWREFTERTNESNSYNHGMQVRHIGACCALPSATPTPVAKALLVAEENPS